MTNSSTSSPQRSATGASLRKTNKPLMEKRRRARINDSLTQLKTLVIQSSKKDSSQFNKLEKADILELTVKHLRNLQSREQHQQGQMSSSDSAGKYCAGFIECANEVIRFLKQSQGFSDEVKGRVVGHLASCLQFTNQPFAKTSPQLPANTAPVLAPATNATVLGSAQPATAAQLSNGQIIHIVNAPFQPAASKPSAEAQYTNSPAEPHHIPKPAESSVAPLASRPQQQYQQQSPVPVLSVAPSNIPATIPSSNTQSSTTSSLPQDKSYMKFSQPLHIQIPNTVSPFVIKGDNRQPQQPLRRAEAEINKNIPLTTAISPAETVHSSVSSTSPSPLPAELPPQAKPSHKHVHFYPGDLHHLHNDYIPRHRTYSVTSSSSESEMSPLNLSQSPVSSSSSSSKDSIYPDSRVVPAHMDYLPIGYKVDKISPVSYSNQQHHQPLYHSRELKENVDLSQHSTNFTSVIVNANRRGLDIPSSKYVTMDYEDDRLCPRQHGTPSPASSMGEERLWRPW